MLQESFIFLPGVQQRTERQLWSHGINTWDDLLETDHIPGVSKERLLFWKGRVRLAQRALETPEGILSLSRQLGARNAWRIANQVMENPRFLDIETTEYANQVTVVGASDGEFYQAFVRGRNLEQRSLRRALFGASCIITFNGSSFDLPILQHRFPGALPAAPHLDLRHICAQAGLRGGLKSIERQLRITLPSAIRETDGVDAIMLWYRHALGDRAALQELIDYNAADVLNLQPLLSQVVPALWQRVRHDRPLPFPPSSPSPLPPGPVPEDEFL